MERPAVSGSPDGDSPFSVKKTVLRALALLGIILFFWCTDLFHTPEPETAVIAGGNLRRPAVLLSVPEYDFSVLVNAPDFLLQEMPPLI